MAHHDQKAQLLTESKNFCMMPWVHMHFWPDGRVFPCCLSDSEKPIAKYGKQSILEAWNSEGLRTIRKNMLADQPSPECARCYLLEKETKIYTLRQMSNETFAKHWGKVASTESDGSVAAVNMAYLDVRFSNLCNFRCHTCGPQLSSSWYEDQVALTQVEQDHPKMLRIEPSEAFWQELEPLLLGVEQCYFAGGEPLISEEHYRVLEYWLSKEKFNHQITYTTNFSQLSFRKWNALDYWKRFPRVSVSASLDASGARAEYLRKGTNWDRIVRNREAMLRECPKVQFEITPTISAFNVWHFPDFFRDWVERGLLDVDSLRLNLLSKPGDMAVAILPPALRRETAAKYREARDHLIARAQQEGKPFANMKSGYDSIIGVLEKDELPREELDKLRVTLKDRLDKLDKIREENLVQTFPELVPFMKEAAVAGEAAAREAAAREVAAREVAARESAAREAAAREAAERAAAALDSAAREAAAREAAVRESDAREVKARKAAQAALAAEVAGREVELAAIWPGENKRFVNITWQVNDVCNYRCSYCNSGNWGAQYKNLQTERYIKVLGQILDHFHARGYRSFKFYFSGGEPTLWPPLKPVIEFLRTAVDRPKIAVNTNLSRPLAWWKENEHLFHEIVASFHVEGVKKEEYLEKVEYLQYRMSYLACRLLMHDERFREVAEFADLLRSRMKNCVLEYAPLFEHMTPHSDMHTYQEEWKREYLRTHQFERIRETQFVLRDEPRSSYCGEVGRDGVMRLLNSNRLVAEGKNNFTGWKCWVDESIFIAPNGQIRTASCNAGSVIGNMNDGYVRLDGNPVICAESRCNCGTDINIRKVDPRMQEMVESRHGG